MSETVALRREQANLSAINNMSPSDMMEEELIGSRDNQVECRGAETMVPIKDCAIEGTRAGK